MIIACCESHKKNTVFFGSYLEVLKMLDRFTNVELAVVELRKNESEIKEFCKSNSIHCVEVESLNEIDEFVDAQWQSTGVVASFGLLFKQEQIKLFDSVFNFHPGCVFANRGRHPLPNAILNGLKSMALSVHKITDEKIDAGQFVSKIEFSIDYSSSYNENYKRLLSAIEFLAQDLSMRIVEGRIPSFDFDPNPGSYFKPLLNHELENIINAVSLERWSR